MYHLKKVLRKDAKPGMEVGKMLMSKDNRVIVNEGTILSDVIIEGLSVWGIREIFIREHIGEGQVIEEQKSENEHIDDSSKIIPSFSKSVTEEQQQFYAEYEGTMNTLKDTFNNISYFKEVPIDKMKELAGTSIEKMISTTGVINHIYTLHRQDEYTFQHSMNVAIICGILGKWLKIKGDRLKDLVLAGLLHDVGKASIPDEVLNKPGKLTEEEFNIIKQHPTYGYQMVQKTQSVSRDVLLGILQHHEKMDGTGYPLGADSSRINEFAKIISVADIYDALTAERVYKKGVAPFLVVEMMLNEMFGKLDPSTCFTFLNNIKDTLIGSIVFLSDGREAEVIHVGQHLSTRPVVYASDGEIINLEEMKHIHVVGARRK